ncbi:catalase [Rummeliibacillus sp. G93]|uniref:catalase n=1 Tax=Rummeliibacillus TaxID=648802 RepID=UPI00116E82F0|nr:MULTISPECIES: catalase [Rummeliibacillus]MBB5171662.1 catalase [Rummeliibacillus stabekisii]UQW97067.1 catalase [Rummeliibacillus sp. G93]GEL06269.1 catalase-2 [Rummeliibacillus stabekisii]
MDKYSQNKKSVKKDAKQEQLDQYRKSNAGKPLTTQEGRKISNDSETLKAGVRGPSLHEDYWFLEKMSHFVHEEIPERIVHARGYGAYGEFECYQSMEHVTEACLFQEPGKKTPLAVRFSTVQGPKGSYDTARDLRCLGVKFYTEQGNYDLTTIAMPVLINQDPMKFPDAMHAYQSKQSDDIPTATGAHDRFWDYVANNPEALHMVTWIMSDRGIIENYRVMESWSINTYLFVNKKGVATFVRFVWKPVLGVHSLLQDEAMKIGGIDPDFHRKDLREAIDKGAFPEYELGVQLIAMEDEFKFDFDILDPAKFWPEELVPVQLIGKMTLNRNIDNYFSESEQIAFNPANVVPGIGFSNDPVLQGRLIAYRDAQQYRLGSANYLELPVNKPLCPFHNNQRRGTMRMRIDENEVNYHNNSLMGNTPHTSSPEEGGYVHYPTKVEGHVIRGRSESFNDYFSQVRIFWNSLTPIEKQHTIEAFSFQLGKVKSESVREQNVDLIVNVDRELACIIADNIGVRQPSGTNVPVDTVYPSLSQANTPKYPYTQKVGVLIGDGFNGQEVMQVLNFLESNGVFIDIISERLGNVTGTDGTQIKVNQTFITGSPYLVDALYVVGGTSKYPAKFMQDVSDFVHNAYKHYKPIGVGTSGQSFIQQSQNNNLEGVVFAANNPNFNQDFLNAITQQRFWSRT